MLGVTILISSLIGLGLVLQGATGIRGCDNPNLRQAKKHISRTKKCFIFFGVIYVIKVFVDIGLVADIGESLEMQMHKVPKLVEEHNKYNNNPHIVLVYKNGTTLFAENNQALHNFDKYSKPPSKEKFGRGEFKYEQGHWDNPRNPHRGDYYKYEIGEVVYFDSRTNTLTILIDKIQGHVKEIIIGIYLAVTVLNVLVFVAICGCIMCCNVKYKRYSDEVAMHANNQAPPRQNFNPSETQIELVSYREES
jgi:hypothetical protein